MVLSSSLYAYENGNNRILLAGPKLPLTPATRFFNIRHDPELCARISRVYFYFYSDERMQCARAWRNIALRLIAINGCYISSRIIDAAVASIAG